MVDQPPGLPSRSAPMPQALTRLRARATMLVILVCVVIVLTLASNLPAVVGVLAVLVVAVAAAVLPVPTITVQRSVPGEVAAVAGLSIAGFANALTDPCLVLDRRSVVQNRNAAAARRFPNITPGNPITFALRNPELVQAIDQVWRTGQTRIIELHETLHAETWEKVAIAPLDNAADDDEQLLLLTFQSLTELKRVDAMRTDFIANASHELRTPLTSLLGFIDTLLGPAAKDAAARDKFLLIMRGQAERMAKLIEDLLSLSRIEMHQHVRPTGSVNLLSLLAEVRDGLQMQAQAAEVDITLDAPGEAVTVTGDREELYEVFENLIENAIKYGGSGKTVELVVTQIAQPGLSHMVSVIDHGPGVEPEHVPRLTERFYRIDADNSRRKKGTGLGLAIAKHIVSRHRGQLTIRSRPGEGMRVDVLLPR